MKLNDLVKETYENAKAKGWHDSERSALEIHALIISEVAEAIEAVRSGAQDYYVDAKGKPEGESVELADALIRICDYFGAKGWDLEQVVRDKLAYNKTRGYRHGGKVL